MRVCVLPLAFALALGGCGQNHSQASKQPKTVGVADSSGGTETISGSSQHDAMKSSNDDESVQVYNNGTTPNLPAFVPVIPGATVKSSVVTSRADGTSGTLIIEANASVDAVTAFYKQKMLGQGFRQATFLESEGSTVFTATTGKNSVQVRASPDNGATRAQITWSTGN